MFGSVKAIILNATYRRTYLCLLPLEAKVIPQQSESSSAITNYAVMQYA